MRIPMFMLLLVLLGCSQKDEPKTEREDCNPGYSDMWLDTELLEDFNPDHITNCYYYSKGKDSFIACLKNGNLLIYSVENQQYIDSVEIPVEYKRLWNLKVNDPDNFILYTSDVFIVCLEGQFYQVPTLLDHSNLVVKNKTDLELFPTLGRFAFEVIDYDSTSADYLFDYNFLAFMDLEGHLYRVGLTYPERYGDGVLGEPRAFFSSNETQLIVSLNYDDHIHLIDADNLEVSSKVLRTNCMSLKEIPREIGDRNDKLFAMDDRTTYFESYSKAFYDHHSRNYYRFFTPRLPRQLSNGKFTTSQDRRQSLIKWNSERDEYDFYKLPAGRYYMRAYWWMSNDTLTYLKRDIYADKEDRYYMDRIYTYSYVHPF